MAREFTTYTQVREIIVAQGTLTAQQVFDAVALHLSAQGRAAANPDGTCLYRDDDGAMCAVGCLIPDERYNPIIEGDGVNQIFGVLTLDSLEPHTTLLIDLQDAHDWALSENGLPSWANRMRDIARDHGLDPAALGRWG